MKTQDNIEGQLNFAQQAKEKRTKTVIDGYRGLPGEFMMLKGLLCMSHFDEHPELRDVFDGIMIAQRMDDINNGAV